MSKIKCLCGNLISDNTDFISYKARFIADQDYFDLRDEIENRDFYKQNAAFIKYFQEIFQCSECQNVIFLSQNRRFDFQPLEKQPKPTVLQSALGDGWKGVMSANFYDGKGEIWWFTNTDGGFKQKLTLSELKKIYFDKFNELQSRALLRSAFLRIEGEIVHKYGVESE